MQALDLVGLSLLPLTFLQKVQNLQRLYSPSFPLTTALEDVRSIHVPLPPTPRQEDKENGSHCRIRRPQQTYGQGKKILVSHLIGIKFSPVNLEHMEIW